MNKIFIDGQAGTTGLQIQKRMENRSDIELLSIDPEYRKSPKARQAVMQAADIVILCLPDDAAREAVALMDDHTRVLDASSAFRVAKDWTYGLPELHPEQRKDISEAQRVSNPGCYATGFLLAITPLIAYQLLPKDSLVSAHAVSGYSGGGRNLIERFQAQAIGEQWHSRPYALTLNHKHLPEMQHYAQLEKSPLFAPSVGHYYQGMLVTIPLFREQLAFSSSITNLQEVIADYYANEPCIRVHAVNDNASLIDGYLDPESNNGSNRVDLFVFGNDRQMQIIARLDNLGKGASGAAVQNINLMLGTEELTSLET
ncbi:MAG: N-acetyl-gamma-glutamyl-phosphate reductase [Gammaproteobacteria bacterium]|nr:N-acetyl-gamma-glutamyl-phosphate reductase [Gammaproteobacteria bacterium]